jgi:hypothetical protein
MSTVYEGIRAFLAARGISLAEGSAHDCESADTVEGLGQRKTHLFREVLRQGVAPPHGAQITLETVAAGRYPDCRSIIPARTALQF